jgi:hypothetical protein
MPFLICFENECGLVKEVQSKRTRFVFRLHFDYLPESSEAENSVLAF